MWDRIDKTITKNGLYIIAVAVALSNLASRKVFINRKMFIKNIFSYK